MRFLLAAASSLYVLSFPLFLITTPIGIAAGLGALYSYGFEKYGVSQATGLSKGELARVAGALIHYFRSDVEPLSIEVMRDGRALPLFNEREVAHLRDVKGLLQLSNRIQLLSLAYLLLYVVISWLVRRGAALFSLARVTFQGSLFTLALLTFFAFLTLLDFPALFLQFHLLSFSNQLWILDPSTDYLIRMFPEGFFLDAALLVAGLSALMASALGGLSWAYLRGRS